MVWSCLLCHRHLWPVLSFFATGICVQSLSFKAFSAVGIRVRVFCLCACLRVSMYLSFWHHALRLPLVRRVGGRGRPASILCSMDRRLTNGWPMVLVVPCVASRDLNCLVCGFFFFFFFFFFSFLVSVFLLFSFLSFVCLMSSNAKLHSY